MPDVPVCVEINMTRGWCRNTISGTEFFVDDKTPWNVDGKWKGKTWWDIRPAMVLVPAEVSWAPLKAFIIKSCKSSNQCQADVRSWDRTVEQIDTHLDAKLK